MNVLSRLIDDFILDITIRRIIFHLKFLSCKQFYYKIMHH